ncbi:hypothetical protein CLU90_0986 [Janthinobacterium sp. 67]|uniref:hypothetical protein n=1 Tax=Janthinobacterium sp. 67 TaxID=2035207 RepID=UPI000C24B798|nr:hypothetical protein [Janthinobacterium sp. 67]PJJ17806.1 hypothetical protein CLU90_0986 [Janthinobacterium sp. 67]
MSVTQNYKTFKLSASNDVIQYIVKAVMQKLFADQDRIRITDSPALVSFLSRDIAFGSDALTALNCRSMRYQAIEGEMLDTVLLALRNQRGAAIQNLEMMRRMFSEYQAGKLGAPWVHQGDVDRKQVAISDIDAALLFLENLK